MKDSYGREINYLRISVTDLCNLKCRYCIGDKIHKLDHCDILRIEEIIQIVKVFVKLGVCKIRLTGGEPLVRRGILTLVEQIGKMDNVKDFAMTTNGALLWEYAKDLKRLGLDRVNVSLDTLDEQKYDIITRGGDLKKTLLGIKKAKTQGLYPIKINNVLIGGFNEDEILDFVALTKNNDIDVRFIELMPIGCAKEWSIEKFISSENVLQMTKLIPVKVKDISSPAKYYKVMGSKGRVGLINPISCKFCKHCNRARLTSDGKLKMCLHSDEEIDLKRALRSGEDIEKIIKNAIWQKPKSHYLKNGQYTNRDMVTIGG